MMQHPTPKTWNSLYFSSTDFMSISDMSDATELSHSSNARCLTLVAAYFLHFIQIRVVHYSVCIRSQTDK
jgi:hypothetical protein